MNYIGLMSGTSMDAVDAALVRFDGDTVRLVAYRQYPIDEQIRAAVRKLDAQASISDVTRLDHVLGHLFADAVLNIMQATGVAAEDVAAIGSHGQTVLHLPAASNARSLQIGDGNIVAYRTGITTVTDFRRMDMAAGGEGAPLAPVFHDRFFRSPVGDRVVLNLGGMANITILPADPTRPAGGFDTGPGNGLLDDWNQLHNHTQMDRDGAWAARGKVHDQLLRCLLDEPYFRTSPPKSTGRDFFNLDWLGGKLAAVGEDISPVDVQSTLVELSARSISEAITQFAGTGVNIYICGGGVHNPYLLRLLRHCMPDTAIATTDALGLDPDAVEACAFAWLARQRLELLSGNLPAVTGASQPVMLGAVYQRTG